MAPLDQYITEKLANGFRVLPVEWQHAASVQQLPWHPGAPSDRLLVAQATIEHLAISSSDPAVGAYGVKIIW